MTAWLRGSVSVAVAGATAAHLVPSVGTVPALHRRLLPRLAGQSAARHVALTFDDGPDPESTPAFLDALGRSNVRATFFLLGTQLVRDPELAQRIVARGHEVAVHGWRHRPHLLRTPWAVHTDIARARDLIEEVTGQRPRFWRPPNGVLSGAGLMSAYRLGLQPVLWTADGRDWQAQATPATVLARLNGQLGAGGTVLLHDSDVTSAPGSWHAALGALPELLRLCEQYGWTVGPLREHWPAA
ncbi:MAG: polysaccharide deacetylase family protein [Actinobacteria bacterium]|nr:polysaccharide deacetylase family protein [Actinomycetota bacterium]